MTEHKCNTCFYNFERCAAKNIIWGIDLNPSARGAEADKVIECGTYIPTARIKVMPNDSE